MSEVHNKLGKILRTTPETLLDLEQKMEKLTDKSGLLAKIVEENNRLIEKKIAEFGLGKNQINAQDIYNAAIKPINLADNDLREFLGRSESTYHQKYEKLCQIAVGLNKPAPGFFIKKEVAARMLEKFPPVNLLDHFGYKSVGELIEKKDFTSVFSALRFIENEGWMHRFFDEVYNDLTPDDFEEREVELEILAPEWFNVAEKFLKKKYHNVSHLKELGIIFVIPLPLDIAGETLRTFMLILHYLNEVPFYSKLFKKFSSEPDFIEKFKSLLRGDVLENKLPEGLNFRIVQRYLAKDNPNDFRLAEPHINPEAEHWYKAEGDLAGLPLASFSDLQSMDFAGDFFVSKNGGEGLVSFDLIDLIMSLVKGGEIKYLYHQQEALWNKIFIEYLGRDKIEELVEQNIIGGFIKL